MGNSLLRGTDTNVERIEEGFGACRCRHETCIIIGLRDATPTENCDVIVLGSLECNSFTFPAAQRV